MSRWTARGEAVIRHRAETRGPPPVVMLAAVDGGTHAALRGQELSNGRPGGLTWDVETASLESFQAASHFAY